MIRTVLLFSLLMKNISRSLFLSICCSRFSCGYSDASYHRPRSNSPFGPLFHDDRYTGWTTTYNEQQSKLLEHLISSYDDLFECARSLTGDYVKKVSITTNIMNGCSTTVRTTTEAGITVVETYENDVLKSRRVSRDRPRGSRTTAG
jgi:hypothetical protein